MKNLLIVGLTGRMGQAIARLAPEYDLEVVGGVGFGESNQMLIAPDDLKALSPQQNEMLSNVDVMIDFSGVHGFESALLVAERFGIPLVSGSTGLDSEAFDRLDTLADQLPVLHGSNMSLGINLLTALLPGVAAGLKGYDIEIVDIHHNQKKDAPSGTAIALADAIDKGREGLHRVFGREGLTGARSADEMAIHALRAGDIVGDHTVYFCGPGERIELTHRAHSRDTFAQGALAAAKWLLGRSPGRYTMHHVLGLEKL